MVENNRTQTPECRYPQQITDRDTPQNTHYFGLGRDPSCTREDIWGDWISKSENNQLLLAIESLNSLLLPLRSEIDLQEEPTQHCSQ